GYRPGIPEDIVDFSTGGFMIPAVFLPDQDQPNTRTAAVTIVGATAVPIIKPISISSTTKRACAVLIGQKPGIDSELRQDFARAVADRILAARRRSYMPGSRGGRGSQAPDRRRLCRLRAPLRAVHPQTTHCAPRIRTA